MLISSAEMPKTRLITTASFSERPNSRSRMPGISVCMAKPQTTISNQKSQSTRSRGRLRR